MLLTITKEQYIEWRNAVYNAQGGHTQSINNFKNKNPELYKHISSMLRKRTKLKSIIEAYLTVSDYVYWGTLTWDNENNNLEEKTKRKQALRFLDKFFKLRTLIEEYGEENGRYHIHFIGILRDNFITYESMYSSWHSRAKVECLKPYECNKKVKYLTKYCVKQVPRIRMDKRSVKLLKQHKTYKRMMRFGFDFYESTYNEQIQDIKELASELPF